MMPRWGCLVLTRFGRRTVVGTAQSVILIEQPTLILKSCIDESEAVDA